MVQKFGKNQENPQGWEIGDTDNILTVQDKQIVHILSNTNISL